MYEAAVIQKPKSDKNSYHVGQWYSADHVDWHWLPGKVWGLVQGWQEHSGATWGRLKVGLVSHSRFQWSDEDIRKIARDDAMDGWRLTHFQLVEWPAVPEEIRE